MTTVAIMQPTYLPWCGYFDMIDQADVFVLLDTVAIDRKSWQTRNRILGRDGNVVWLSIPTHAHQGQIIREVTIDYGQNWITKHLRSLRSAYGESRYYWDQLEQLLEWRYPYLATMNFAILRWLCRELSIKTTILSSAEFAPPDVGPLERVAFLCEAVGADELLNAPGAKHLYPEDFPVPNRWHEYEPQRYEQNGVEFVSHLSVIDALARLGPEQTLDLIRAGRMSSAAI